MALQTSGAISFANLQSEFGGSHPITMGEYASFRVSGSGNTISMNQFYGAQSALDTQTVTVGYYTVTFYGSTTYMYGDTPSPSQGSISDGTANWAGGKTYKQLYYSSNNFNTDKGVSMALIGNQANSGFTTMTINGVNFARSSATYSYISSMNQSNWFWQYSTNVFGTTVGATKTVTFT